ncbi:MAG: endonuclease NucS domain-containing protein [Candidatus Thorarchaeota archaeon]
MNSTILNENEDFSSFLYEVYFNEHTPQTEVKKVMNLLVQLEADKQIKYNVINPKSDEELNSLADEIRIAATKHTFRVVSGGGAALVLSGTKKMNFPHGPILVIRNEGNIVRVYPSGEQGIKGSRITAFDYLRRITRGDDILQDYHEERTFSENDLRNLVINSPRVLEEGLSFHDIEVDVGSAIVDLVMIDKDKNHLLLEFKLTAKDRTIGQITRYSIENYAAKLNIPVEKIRRGIVTLSVSGQLIEACQTNQIELYIVQAKNFGFIRK